MAEDEKIDGVRIAADILNKMSSANKERIVKEIQQKHPEIAEKIESNLFNFSDIAELTSQGVQVLIKEVEHDDLVLSLKTASSEVKEVLFNSMTERKQKLVEDDFEALSPVRPVQVEDAQKRILAKLDELRTQGLIRTKSSNDFWV